MRLGCSCLKVREYRGEGQWYSDWKKLYVVTVDNREYELCIKNMDNGSCFFHSEDGCRLPVEERPKLCHIYPFWVVEEKIVIDEDRDRMCPYKNVKKAMIDFKTSPKEIMELYKAFVAECDRQKLAFFVRKLLRTSGS
jgi:Fe-S-cluster containining protein